jgi:hypothetical protein
MPNDLEDLQELIQRLERALVLAKEAAFLDLAADIESEIVAAREWEHDLRTFARKELTS